jgi:hypothetical protein
MNLYAPLANYLIKINFDSSTFLLLAVAKEEGCSLEPAGDSDSVNALLNKLAPT